MHPGSGVALRRTLDGASTRKIPLAQKLSIPTVLAPSTWHGAGVLQLTPVNAAHSVWWFFTETGAFQGWYINLEDPARRWAGGVDTFDHALDVAVEPDRSWVWKDEDEFAERTGVLWDRAQAEQIRAEGEAMVALVEAGDFPFDGTWCDFAPDPRWGPTPLPWWWDQVPDQTGMAAPDIR